MLKQLKELCMVLRKYKQLGLHKALIEEEIKEKSATLATLLVNSKITEFDNNTVSIELPITNGYFQTTLEKSKKFIQDKMGEKVSQEIKVKFIHLIKEENAKEDVVEKAKKIFDARIVKK